VPDPGVGVGRLVMSRSGQADAAVGTVRRRGHARLPSLRVAFAALALALAVAGCTTLPKAQVSRANYPATEVPRAAQRLEIFHRVWDLVNRRHFDPQHNGVDWEHAAEKFGPLAAAAPDEKALYRTLNEMLGLLQDSHTHALTPLQARERRTQQRVRTGFNLARVEGRWVVTEVLPDSPAERAGVKSGWIAVAREGVPLGPGIDFRPKEGEAVRWDFLDEQDRTITLAPRATRLSTAARQIVRALPDGMLYLRFDEFDGTDRRWLSRQLKEHADAPGVVIDLRRNPGGETFSLGISIGEFFDHAVDCGTFISRSGGRAVKYSWQFGSARYRAKVAILVDGPTGSAAEIFSAVLQDHGRATLIGRRTTGAVLASWFHRLPDGGELQLSLEDYVAPKGRRIEGKGIDPDIVVSRTLADIRAGRDPDLEMAQRVLRGENPPGPPAAAAGKGSLTRHSGLPPSGI
jgi:carboxyl-terminal processing protease